VRAIVVDDHAPFRANARELLELEGFEVVGEAADGASALALVATAAPERVLLDVGLPDVSGFELAAQLAASATVILVSNRDRSEVAAQATRSAAAGFVPKEEFSGEALHALLARTG
jgi:DNA-binding NarL/FixJ family response regulator